MGGVIIDYIIFLKLRTVFFKPFFYVSIITFSSDLRPVLALLAASYAVGAKGVVVAAAVGAAVGAGPAKVADASELRRAAATPVLARLQAPVRGGG